MTHSKVEFNALSIWLSYTFYRLWFASKLAEIRHDLWNSVRKMKGNNSTFVQLFQINIWICSWCDNDLNSSPLHWKHTKIVYNMPFDINIVDIHGNILSFITKSDSFLTKRIVFATSFNHEGDEQSTWFLHHQMHTLWIIFDTTFMQFPVQLAKLHTPLCRKWSFSWKPKHHFACTKCIFKHHFPTFFDPSFFSKNIIIWISGMPNMPPNVFLHVISTSKGPTLCFHPCAFTGMNVWLWRWNANNVIFCTDMHINVVYNMAKFRWICIWWKKVTNHYVTKKSTNFS